MQATQKGNELKSSILKALSYFEIFKFPLYFDEIHKFTGTAVNRSDLKAELDELVLTNMLFEYEGLYMRVDDEQWAIKRIISSNKAVEKMKEAVQSGSVIANFPFVKAVFVSGSLSKGYADDKSDIDFFIITSKNRLWICRSLLHVFKKLTFLANKQHSYCMNYFIDESRICLEEQNIYTATEIATLIPIYQKDRLYNRLIENNDAWVAQYFPNFSLLENAPPVQRTSPLKNITEAVLNMTFPGAINKALMTLTDKWWRYKWQKKNYPMEDYEIAMKTRWYVSKNHPANYQKKILQHLKVQLSA